jgi:hypothetical protein
VMRYLTVRIHTIRIHPRIVPAVPRTNIGHLTDALADPCADACCAATCRGQEAPTMGSFTGSGLAAAAHRRELACDAR